MNFVELRELETARLRLRRIRFEDLYDYYERIYSDGDVTRYMLFDPHQDIGESLQSIEKTLERYEEGGCYRWGIALKEDDSLIGVFDLLRFDEEEESCSFAYMLGKRWWNQGYATEAMKEVFRFAFEELGVKKIAADHMAPNAASGAVMRKAGMVQVGVIPGKYVKHGQIHDAVCYELSVASAEPLTANEYQKKAMTTLNPALSRRDVLLNGVMGLCGEAGECIDLVKKHLHQGHVLDKGKLAKELGDVAWYLAETAWALELPLEEILRGNLEKLRNRYPEGFETERSVNR
ncbi:MAG: GNAT family N-acetyltransferase [Ruminococcaceae bacterium]|nr:GNAT family N-acetyltransferase [Oscillospiraceae bacterium]